MNFLRPLLFLCLLAVFGGMVGYSLATRMNTGDVEGEPIRESSRIETDSRSAAIRFDRETVPELDSSELEIQFPRSAIQDELVLQFESTAEYAAYLEALRNGGFSPFGQIDNLFVLRIDTRALAKVPPTGYTIAPDYNYEVIQPLPPLERSPEVLASLRGYRQSAREIVGGIIDGDGTGVSVAVLDSGIYEHVQFKETDITQLDLVGEGIASEGAEHGTSVASIIAGAEGVAPCTELVIIRVLDSEGQGNTFHVAKGIVEAVDLGVDIINLSLAVYQDSAVVRNAVSYALSRDVILVAAAGNDGYDRMPYPAAYEGVLSVTAVDANERHALFPNQSKRIDLAAPGVGILTAAKERGTTLFTGTSAAAPFVSGTLASMLSAEPAQSSKQIVATLKRYLNEAGSVGEDPFYGDGILDANRLRERNAPGILDIALADIHLDPTALPGTTMPIEVIVQNRGTQWFPESELEVVVGTDEPATFSIGSLGPGLTTTRKVFTQVPAEASEKRLEIIARIIPEDLNSDVRLENNLKGAFYQSK